MIVKTKELRQVDVRRDDGADLSEEQARQVAERNNEGWVPVDFIRRNYDHIQVVMEVR
jgi:hypothetical protein